LMFEKKNGSVDMWPVDDFLEIFRQVGCELIFLNSCESTSSKKWPSLAHAMKANGVRHLIAMSHEIKDGSMQTFGDVVFQTIIGRRETIETAVLRARSEIKEYSEIGAPVLYAATILNQNPFVCPQGSSEIVDPSPVCHLHNIKVNFNPIR